MADELPSDVLAVLTQLFETGETAVLSGEFDTARQTVTTAKTVSRNKLPDGELRGQLVHGCTRVNTLLAAPDDEDVASAAEYLRTMERRLDQSP